MMTVLALRIPSVSSYRDGGPKEPMDPTDSRTPIFVGSFSVSGESYPDHWDRMFSHLERMSHPSDDRARVAETSVPVEME